MANVVTRVGCLAAGLLLVACAASPEAEDRRAAAEADIKDILSQSLASDGAGEPVRCVSDSQIRNYRALDTRYVLFEGRRDELWINVLRGRCSDLRHGSVMSVNRFSGSRLCDGDRFTVADLFDFPPSGRRPAQWGTDVPCTFGDFYPVSAEQAGEIEAVLRRD